MASNVSWTNFQNAIDELAHKISGVYEPTVLIAIARGGWIPVRYLSDALGVKRIASFGITYETTDRSSPCVYSTPAGIDEDAAVLLVEDFLESGRSIVEAKAILETRYEVVRTAAMWVSSGSLHIPDFTLGALAETPQFPWERDTSVR